MTRSHAFLILLFLSIVTLILLSGCASENKVQYDDSAIPSNMSETVNNSGEDANTAPAEVPNQEETEVQPVVTMTIWSYEMGEEFTYTLTPEDADRIVTIFNHAEKEELTSPLADLPTLCFRFGEDYLDAPMEFPDVFSGRLDGKPMLARLDEESCNVIREIVYRYASPDMPNEWSDTPSADAE